MHKTTRGGLLGYSRQCDLNEDKTKASLQSFVAVKFRAFNWMLNKAFTWQEIKKPTRGTKTNSA